MSASCSASKAWFGTVARCVLRHELGIWVLSVRVVVPPAIPGMTRDRVQVPPVLLDVLAVVTLAAGQAEQPLLENRVLFHSTAPGPDRAAGGCRRIPPVRPRPSGTHGNARGHAA